MKTLLTLLSFVISSAALAHSTSIDMSFQSLTAALAVYEQTNKAAQYYALDSWIEKGEFKVELTQIKPNLELASFTCHHQDQEGHDDHHTMVDCLLDKQGLPDGSLVTESMAKENHLDAVQSAMTLFKSESKARPADQLMQGFWNIRSYRKANITKVKIRSAIAGNSNSYRELTYVCNVNSKVGCETVPEEKIVERKGN
jgi:hypothetical protein